MISDEELMVWRDLGTRLQDPDERETVAMSEEDLAKALVRLVDELRSERAQTRVFRGAIGRVLDLGAQVLRGDCR